MLDQIASFIEGHNHFAISTHMSPDGDAVGSLMALFGMLKRLDKSVVPVMRDPVPRHLKFLPNINDIVPASELADDEFEQAIVVDCGAFERVGEELHQQFKGRYVINIDHHTDNPKFGNLHLIRDWPSCTMLIDALLSVIGVELDSELATCLYVGLFSDTNAFRNANVNADALRMAAKWVDAGADPYHISQQLFEQQRWSEMQLLGHALSQTRREHGIVWCTLSRDIFSQLDVHPNDSDAVMGQLRSIEGVHIAILFKEIDQGKVKISFRSKSDVPVNTIAQHFGGGGHIRAAGCLVSGKLEEVVEEVVAHTKAQLTQALPS